MPNTSIHGPIDRRGYFTDRDGVMSVCQYHDEISTLTIDWTDRLASGETVSSVAYSSSGPTTSGATLVSPVSTVVVTGSGELTITATLSSGSKVIRVVRYVEPQSSDSTSDYDD